MRSTIIASTLALAICAGHAVAGDAASALRNSMRAKNQAGMDRLEQSELQAACSTPADKVADETRAAQLQKAAQASVKMPADGQFIGDWKRGQAIAAEGRGLQSSDPPGMAAGGNCYACHELDAAEAAYGTLGPSLRNYGQRGQTQPVLEYTWSKLWNPNAWVLCSHMPRFGAAGILDEQQLKDLMALLLDPASPVNR